MIPDPQAMLAHAKKLEQAMHRFGWDAPPSLGWVTRIGAGYRSFPAPVQPCDLSDNPVQGLLMIANATLRGTSEAREVLRQEGIQEYGRDVAGAWFLSEGWATQTEPDGRDGRSIADMPGAQEVRFLVMIDFGGRSYWVDRFRGEKPVAAMAGPQQAAARMDSRVPEALLRLIIATAANMPEGSVDMDALGVLAGAAQATEGL